MNDPMDAAMQSCIQNCTECRNMCLQTITYCFSMGGKHAETAHLKSLLDCIETCASSASFMLRGSDLYSQMCGVCAWACGRCATSCERFPNDVQMKACAQICRRCAESCREMEGVKA
jgi:hypothetical protein